MNKTLASRIFNAMFSTATSAAVPAMFNNITNVIQKKKRGIGFTKAPSTKRAKGRAHALAR